MVFCQIIRKPHRFPMHYRLPILPQSKKERKRSVQTTGCPTSKIFTPSDMGGGGNHVIVWPLRVQGTPCKPNCPSNHFQTCNSVNIISKMSSFMESIMFIERRRLISELGFQNESPISSTWIGEMFFITASALYYPKSPSLAAIN